MTEIVLIAAVASNGVIGDGASIPWHFPRDLKHFRGETMGSPVIMGRTTFERIVNANGGPLDGRSNIVLTRSPHEVDEDVYVVTGVSEALHVAGTCTDGDVAYVAGGGEVYAQTIDMADRLLLTEVHDAYEGETVFPEWPLGDEWVETERIAAGAFDIATYERGESE